MNCYTLGEVLIENLKEGMILPDEEFTITITNLKDTDGDLFEGFENGVSQSFTYKCGSLPTTIVEEIWPAEFLSFWPKGDEAGMHQVAKLRRR